MLLFNLRNKRKTCGRLQAVLELISMIPPDTVFTTGQYSRQRSRAKVVFTHTCPPSAGCMPSIVPLWEAMGGGVLVRSLHRGWQSYAASAVQ